MVGLALRRTERKFGILGEVTLVQLTSSINQNALKHAKKVKRSVQRLIQGL